MTPEEAVEIVMQPHDDIVPLIAVRHPDYFETNFMLARLKGVREHSRRLFETNKAHQLWVVADAMGARLLKFKGRKRRFGRRRASRDRIPSLDIATGIDVLNDANREMEIEFPAAAAAGISPDFTLRHFPKFPDWSKTFFGNQIVVSGVPGWQRCAAVITHPMLIESGRDMFHQWVKMRESPEFQAARLSHSRMKKIERTLKAATQGVMA